MYGTLVFSLLIPCWVWMLPYTPGQQHAPTSSMQLEQLKQIFNSPNCSDENTVCKTLIPKDVESYLSNEVNRSVQKLCLIIKPSPVWTEKNLILDPLQNLTSLRWLWLQSEALLHGTLRLYKVSLHLPDMVNSTLPLTRLFINTPLYGGGIQSIAPFIKQMHQLQVLSLSNTRNVNKDNLLPDIIQSLQGKPLQALSLKGFQNIANFRDRFLLKLNITELFWPLQDCPLEYLDLSYNNFLNIQPGISKMFQNLRILDVSHNDLVAADNKGMLIELVIHPKMQVLHLNNQGTVQNSMGRVKRKASTAPETSKDSPSILPLMHHCMAKLNLTFLDMLVKSVFCELIYCIDQRYLSEIPCEALPSYQQFIAAIDFSCTYDFRIPIAPNLQELYADELHISATSEQNRGEMKFCFGPNKVQKLTFSRNKVLTKDLYLDEDLTIRRVDGLDHIEHIDLSDNGLEIPLNSPTLQSLPAVRILSLNGNYISLNNSDVCQGNTVLQDLYLRKNEIEEIPENFVAGCTSLKTLDLSQNSLADIYTLISRENHLQLLNASNNRIRSLNKKTIDNLKKISSQGPLKIDLFHNPWDCGCGTMDILDSMVFMKSAHTFNITFHRLNEYQCFRKGSYYFLQSTDVDHLRNICFPSNWKLIAVTVVTTVSLLLFVLLLVMCYRCRYRINTAYFHTCQKLHQSHSKGDHPDIAYDAFISYAAEDRFWVHDVLKTQLEENYGFRLCLHYRDFPACGDIADVIVNYIARSRSIVVILSENSVTRPWCEFELKSAHAQHLNQGKRLILIKLGAIPRNQALSDLVTDLLNSKVYIEWPETGIKPSKWEKKKQGLFWSKVERAIYGEDYCGCVRYCNPCYNKNDSLTLPLFDDCEL